MVNTSLTLLDPEECKSKPTTKMTKALQDAYRLASENNPMKYYKDVLLQYQKDEANIAQELAEREAEEARVAEENAKATEEAEKEEEVAEAKPKKKKAPRKSKGGDEDVEMEDAEAPKSSKKRKKDAESDGEGKVCFQSPEVNLEMSADYIDSPRRPRR